MNEPAPSSAAPAPLLPAVSLPKGGGAIRGIGEKFAANPATGTGSMSVKLPASAARGGSGPELTLRYDSGAGNGPFGFGWQLSVPTISRKTDRGLPRYGAGEPDTFVLSGLEDLVPALADVGGQWEPIAGDRVVDGVTYRVARYHPRLVSDFARIEQWTDTATGDVHWRSTSGTNVTNVYGRTIESRVADPADERRVFSWLLCETYDDRGNAAVYEYKAESSDHVDVTLAHERNRTDASRSAGRYLKRVRYGNRVSRLIEPDLTAQQWLFEMVFDYGEHDADAPTTHEDVPWPCRADPFSTYRSGFEVRTYRLCRRVLLFHHIPEPGVGDDCVVRSTELTYREGEVASFLTSANQTGWKRTADGSSYIRAALPPLDLTYSPATISHEVREIAPEDLPNAPDGLVDPTFSLVDLDGEGLSGILSEHRGAWLYRPNLGGGRFGALATVATLPTTADAAGHQLVDLAGDGSLDLVSFAGPTPGFAERTSDGIWDVPRPFRSLPSLRWDDPNLRFVDLDGDGHADVLLTGDDAISWYPSLAEDGFGSGLRVPNAWHDDDGPRLVFADGTDTVHLADMSGDGLSDLVRVRNGEVSYWPNLGRGHFGRRVVMDGSPWFDADDRFDPRRVRFADVDGSGNSDVVYLGRHGVHLYLNQAGNAFSDAVELDAVPPVDDPSSVRVTDLLGTGTACVVWFHTGPDGDRVLRYLDLMADGKPHLLVRAVNNLGAETHIQYAPSTSAYLADREAGRPWATKLPFPVHVVDRVTVYDRVARSRFTTRYAYHHGYFDGPEREFRGFGLVEQWDTEELAALRPDGVLPVVENEDPASHVPPVLTRTWFHLGAPGSDGRLSRQYEREYYDDPEVADAGEAALLLPDTVLPPGLDARTAVEASRALKGSPLRREVYGLDGTARSTHPYSVTERNFEIRVVQPRGPNRHAAFRVHEHESIERHYERDPGDPRVTHALTLDVDDFGNVLREATITYGRLVDDPDLSAGEQAEQRRTHGRVTERTFTNAVDTDAAYRTPLIAEESAYELLGLLPPGNQPLDFADAEAAIDGAAVLQPEEAPAVGAVERRLVSRTRTIYRRDDLTGRLAHGALESMAVPFDTHRLALTPGMLATYGGRVDDAMLTGEGGYIFEDGLWWASSGQVSYSPAAADSPAQELAYARTHFFLPLRARDAFGNPSSIAYDDHDLLVLEAVDAAGNRVTAGERDAAGAITARRLDYRVLMPSMNMDANRNRRAVAFDALGLVVGTATMGKPEEDVGDTLDGFVADLDDDAIAAALDQPWVGASDRLGSATSRVVYDVRAFFRTRDLAEPAPAVVATLTRETHAADLGAGEQSRLHHSFSYLDGFEREVQRKMQAEPGLVDGADQARRWVGTGWTISDNKGKPVRTFEPFFTASHRFERVQAAGVSTITFYDPPGRVIGKLRPDHAYEKEEVRAWRRTVADASDNVSVADPAVDPDVGAHIARLDAVEYEPTWYEARATGALGADEQDAAAKAALHAGTPSVAHLDALARPFLTVTHNRYDDGNAIVETHDRTRFTFDAEGRKLAIVDALERVVVRTTYDLLGRVLHEASMEAGERWVLPDVRGMPVRTWNANGWALRLGYDALRRPTTIHADDGSGNGERVVERTTYGEAQPGAEAANLRTRVAEIADGVGLAVNERYDFKGNIARHVRRMADTYTAGPDWSQGVALGEAFVSETTHDAFDRAVTMVAPDGSVLTRRYNDANLLERIEARIGDAAAPVTVLVASIDYDARGERRLIEYGNGVTTRHERDRLTKLLRRIVTTANGVVLQDLAYTYDPAGNVTRTRDAAQQDVFFRNRRVEPSTDYTYDALYRLVVASGREHLGQAGPVPPSSTDAPRVSLDHPGDGLAMGTYTERYAYDSADNLTTLAHRGVDPAHAGWTQVFAYDEASALEPGKASNRLSSVDDGGAGGVGGPQACAYDAQGNMTVAPGIASMRWDHVNRLRAASRQVVAAGAGTPETTYFAYDGAGMRGRKVTDRQAAAGAAPRRRSERIYVGAFEVYREYDAQGTGVVLERQTLVVKDGDRAVAHVETTTVGAAGGGGAGAGAPVVRFQHADVLGTVRLELDGGGEVISYEEHYPYGGTSYQAVRSQVEAPKRLRFTGKERDAETGLAYHGARYYAPWLARWVSADPAGIEAGLNAYEYGRANPVRYVDDDGRQVVDATNAARFVLIFGEQQQSNRQTAHAETLIRAFTDPGINDTQTGVRGNGVLQRTFAILILTGGNRPPNSNGSALPAPHFNWTIRSTGHQRERQPADPAGDLTGDLGFRPELRDSLAGSQHRSSSDQIGHFLTAVDFGIQAQIKQDFIDSQERFRREHPILWGLSRSGNRGGMSAEDHAAITKGVYLRAIVGHELIADGTGSGSDGPRGNVIGALWRPTSDDIRNFENGRLDLIRLDTSQRGNTYQDLLLTWIGYQFGVKVQKGEFTSNAEAARWLRMMLTEQDLAAVPQSDPFYQDAQKLQTLLQQVRTLTAAPQPARTGAP